MMRVELSEGEFLDFLREFTGYTVGSVDELWKGKELCQLVNVSYPHSLLMNRSDADPAGNYMRIQTVLENNGHTAKFSLHQVITDKEKHWELCQILYTALAKRLYERSSISKDQETLSGCPKTKKHKNR